MDAFTVAFRLPNHFRAIFAEGAFNAAFVPAYARALQGEGEAAADRFQGMILSLLLVVQVLLLLLAYLFMPQVVRVLAPGFAKDAAQFDLAVTLTRITFPYLILITLVTLWSGVLNSHGRFAAAAAAPVLLNLAMIAAVAGHFLFPSAAHAAATGVLAAGFLEAALVAFALWRLGRLVKPAIPRLTADVRRFLKAFGPAVIGSAGVQIAMLADTILATLPAHRRAVRALLCGSALSVAARRHRNRWRHGAASGDEPPHRRGDVAGAHRAQTGASFFTLALAAPCVVAFLMIPDLAIRAVFERGRFDFRCDGDGGERSCGLWHRPRRSRADPDRAAELSGARRYDDSHGRLAHRHRHQCGAEIPADPALGVAGLALATSIGAWINLLILAVLALRQGKAEADPTFRRGLSRSSWLARRWPWPSCPVALWRP